MPTDINRRSGHVSKFFYSLSKKGVYTPVTDTIFTTTWNIAFAPNRMSIASQQGKIYGVTESRMGIPTITSTVSSAFRAIQGAGLIRSGIGPDTLAGAAGAAVNMTATSGTAAIGATSLTLVGPIPTPPTGIGDWRGAPLTIQTTPPITVPIFAISGATITTAPLPVAVGTGLATSVAAGTHCFQPGTADDFLWVNLAGIWANDIEEIQAVDAQVNDIQIASSGAEVTMALGIPVNADYNYQGVPTSNPSLSAAELADVFFRLQDCMLYTYGAAADTVVKPHTRLTSFDWHLTTSEQTATEAGTTAVQHVPAVMGLSIGWTENAGDGNFLTMEQDFVRGDRKTPAFLVGTNKANGSYFCGFSNVCAVDQFQKPGPADAIIMRNGALTPQLDNTSGGTGQAFRFWLSNSVVTQYAAAP